MSEVSIEKIRDGHFLVRGALRFETVPGVWREGLRVLSGTSSLVLDLKGVTRSDSAGLALLIEWMREARRRKAQIHYRNIPSQMQAIARVSGLESLLP